MHVYILYVYSHAYTFARRDIADNSLVVVFIFTEIYGVMWRKLTNDLKF